MAPNQSVDNQGTVEAEEELFVGGIPPTTELLELQQYFSKFGLLTECRMMWDKVTSKKLSNLKRSFVALLSLNMKSLQLL